MFLFFYNLFLFIFSPVLLSLLFLRAIIKKKNFKFYLKRLYFQRESPVKAVHFHGVSVGEILSLKTLIEKVKERNCNITISVGTSSGFSTAKKKYSSGAHKIFPAPFELLFSIKSFLKNLEPSVFIVAEAEFWLNLYYFLKKRDIPIWIVNFRLGNEKNYKRFSFYYKKVFSLVDIFFVPEKRYADFLKSFGVDNDKIVLTGNLKADIEFKEISEEEKNKIKENLKIDKKRRVLVCGSTTEGEEELILKVFEKYKKGWQLIIAPRHIERSEYILKMIKEKTELKASLKTELSSEYDVLILNTIGELFNVYSIGDLAFVGGSLKPVGGHNVLEPIFHKVPTLTGNHYENFKDIVEKLKESKGIEILKKADDFEIFLNKEEKELIELGIRGFKALEKMRGGVKKILEKMEEKGIKC